MNEVSNDPLKADFNDILITKRLMIVYEYIALYNKYAFLANGYMRVPVRI